MPHSKVCFKCGISKPSEEFYKHPQMGDGYLGKCKTCTKKDVLEHRLKNIERIREYDRIRGKIPERSKKAAAVSEKWRKADRRRIVCHSAIAKAYRNGTLVPKSCEWDGCTNEHAYAHHESYDRPLDVVFYCQPHHKQRHKDMKRLGIDP